MINPMGNDEKIKEMGATIKLLQECLQQKNKELDALHYVWCSGGCHSGTHRWSHEGPITEEIVRLAEQNTKRLRTWYNNSKND